MKKLIFSLLLLLALPAVGQDWSLRVATGPFVFGDFAERTLPLITGGPPVNQTTRLSAATRAGVAVDLERAISERFAIRAEGTFTRAPLSIKGDDDDGVDIEAGQIDVTTVMLPLVLRINPRGTFRFHVFGGPAYAMYKVERRGNAAGGIRLFAGTRSEWGAALGGGASWNWSDRFALEGQLSDIATASPFRDSEIAPLGRTRFPRPHNIHTTAGIRVRF